MRRSIVLEEPPQLTRSFGEQKVSRWEKIGIEDTSEGFAIGCVIVDVTIAKTRRSEAGPNVELLWVRESVVLCRLPLRFSSNTFSLSSK
jgi:hypothetical protein